MPVRSWTKGFLLVVAMVLLLGAAAGPVAAQADQRCFPETGQCIAGPIRAYWERSGGLAVFGFPITAQVQETVEGQPLQVQWFERDRLEIQANGTVTAGRLGVERLEQMGTPWGPGQGAEAGPGCTAFPETGYQVCGAFAAYWRASGGLERFGYPVTGEFTAELEGKPYTVQYFERRRFELHPEIGPTTVLLGLLGREVYNARQAPPAPQPPAPQPPAEPTPVPGPTIQPPEVLEQYRKRMPAGYWQVNVNGILLTAAGFEYRTEIGRFNRAGDGFKYVVFTLEVANTGYQGRFDDNFFANSASFDLIDLDNGTHDTDSATYSLENYFEGGTFYPGTKSSGMLVYRVPENSAPARLVFNSQNMELDFRVAPNQ
jgi:hypothetical protein